MNPVKGGNSRFIKQSKVIEIKVWNVKGGAVVEAEWDLSMWRVWGHPSLDSPNSISMAAPNPNLKRGRSNTQIQHGYVTDVQGKKCCF
jgi:hypothetical protein